MTAILNIDQNYYSGLGQKIILNAKKDSTSQCQEVIYKVGSRSDTQDQVKKKSDTQGMILVARTRSDGQGQAE